MSGPVHRPEQPDDPQLADLLALEDVLLDARARLTACLRLVEQAPAPADDAVAVPSAATAP
ncbi:MAG TPA: hypothetical protein VNU66_02885 [Mycobacteriales bacterium]|nr:hypothetical protein [Mycobacteriales bacterium]